MAVETSPAFQFYVKEWRSSRAIMRMSFAHRGMYLEMLLEQWETLSLPDDPRAVAELLGGTDEEWIAAWPILRRKFCDRRAAPRDRDVMPTDHDATRRIVNMKLETIRREQKRFKKDSIKNARKGGIARARAAKREKDGTYVPAAAGHGLDAQPAAIQPTPASATPTATATAERAALSRVRPATVFAGALPRDHVNHVACSPNMAWCVPQAVHSALVAAIVPKYGGDRQKAGAALKEWYPTVFAALPGDTAIVEAFKFWRARADTAFATPQQAQIAARTVPGAAATAALVASMRVGVQ